MPFGGVSYRIAHHSRALLLSLLPEKEAQPLAEVTFPAAIKNIKGREK